MNDSDRPKTRPIRPEDFAFLDDDDPSTWPEPMREAFRLMWQVQRRANAKKALTEGKKPVE